jgi:hypothetical protein
MTRQVVPWTKLVDSDAYHRSQLEGAERAMTHAQWMLHKRYLSQRDFEARRRGRQTGPRKHDDGAIRCRPSERLTRRT